MSKEQKEGKSFSSYREKSQLGPLPRRAHTANVLTIGRLARVRINGGTRGS
jgi:hypothetical protein